jgi:Ca2+-binding RTX toxin-like protein
MKRRVAVLLGVPVLVGLSVPAMSAQAAAPTCFGKVATIVGTAGPDTLVGQSGVSDVIYGGGGDDHISGGEFYSDDAIPGAAPDLLCGGPGADVMGGSPGNDKMDGGDGNDEVRGNLGADVMQGGIGGDRLIDESIADMDAKNDILRGGSGNDQLTTAWGVDKAYGDAGNDTIVDSECSTSYLYGGPGADTFESWHSSFEDAGCNDQKDFIDGNDGSDRATASGGDSITRVEDVQRVAGTL